MGVIISVVNQKGGVAKTTTAINVAAAIGQKGKKVLLVDLDPQGNATSGIGINKRELKISTYDVIMGEARPEEAIISTNYKNVSIIPATQALAEGEIRLTAFKNKTLQLKKALLQIKDKYDIIIVDCLPSLGVLALNGLSACDRIIIPMQCEPYSLEGVAELLNTVKRVKSTSNKNLQVMGIVFTMLDMRLTVNKDVVNQIKENFPPEYIFKTVIPRNVKISEAPSHGEPITYYDPASKGAEAYKKLANEVIARANNAGKML
ncbi:MAG: ParA family protein [Firmicutes bacterium]|nr:ParA family protein [[Eubacterium] siraeum]MCM1488262.1 ParA family protein [Bacillota bacterium]